MTREEYEISKAIGRKRAFQEAIAPIAREVARHLSLYAPKIIIHRGGLIEQQYPPEYEKALAQYQELVDLVAHQFGLQKHAGTNDTSR